MVIGRASCTRSTRAFLTKWHTFSPAIGRTRRIVTDLIPSTVLVSCTFHLNTWNLRVALKARWTIADSRVDFNFAECISSTYGVLTGIHTLLWNTSFVQWAVIILQTFIYEIIECKLVDFNGRFYKKSVNFMICFQPTCITFSGGMAPPSTWTSANCTVALCFTFCTLSTRATIKARIYTLVLVASFVVWAFWVMVAFTSFN